MVSIKEVAERAGVSCSTVSRLLAGKLAVKEETRARVMRAVEELDYKPSLMAKSLRSGESRLLGFIIPNIERPFYPKVMKHLEELAYAKGYSIILCDASESTEKESEFLQTLIGLRVDGVVFLPATEETGHILPFVGKLPIVVINRKFDIGLPCVLGDDYDGGYCAGLHLCRLGHRRIAVFGANPVAGDSLARRFDGFCRAFKDRGLTYDSALFSETRFSLQAGYQTAREFIRSHPDITALFAMSDTVAIGAMRAFSDLHMRIPEDISVFGFDGIDLSDFTLPRLATVEQPVNEIARSSVELLMEMLNENAPPRQLLVNAKLRRRESLAPPCTGLPSGADSRV